MRTRIAGATGKGLVEEREDIALEDETLPGTADRVKCLLRNHGRRGPRGAKSDGNRAVWRVKVLYSSATEFCEAPPGMELSVGSVGRRPDALRQRAGQGPRPGDGRPGARRTSCTRSCGSPGPADLVARAGQRPPGGAGVQRVPGEDRSAGARHEARERPLPPGRAEDPVPLHRGEPRGFPRAREGPRRGVQDAHRAAPDRRARRGARRGRRWGSAVGRCAATRSPTGSARSPSRWPRSRTSPSTP